MKRTSPLFLSRGWGEFEWERDKLGKREKGEDSEWGKPKKRSLILRLNDFGVLSNWEEGNSKFEIRKAGREILSKDFRGRSFTKFLVLQKTSKLYFLIISIYISYTLLE